VQRLLIRLPNWLGDLLMARPLLHAVRSTFPGAEVWAIGTPASALLDRERLWDRWLAHDVPVSGRADASPFHGRRFDAALVLPPSFSSAWTLWRLDIGRRIGFAGDLRSWMLTDPVKRPARGERHLSDEYLTLGARIGVRAGELPALRADDQGAALAAARLRRLGIENEPFTILGPGAAYGPAKRWSSERFVALGRRLCGRGHHVLVAGAQADRALAEPIAAAIGTGAHTIAGETSLSEQLALCDRARVTVTNDSGLAHLAAASGSATVVIFGSTSSAWTAPLGRRTAVVQRAPVCAPCFQRTCRIGYRCLEAVSVAAVERACEGLAA
jgi:heptosyltransferase-2